MDPVSFSLLSPVSQNTVSTGPERTIVQSSPEEIQGTSFADVLSQTAEGLAESVAKAEATSIAGIKGEVGAYEVATTVMEAEQQLRMASTIRERLVQAFQEISRMQI